MTKKIRRKNGKRSLRNFGALNIFASPPKLGAKSPPMAMTTTLLKSVQYIGVHNNKKRDGPIVVSRFEFRLSCSIAWRNFTWVELSRVKRPRLLVKHVVTA